MSQQCAREWFVSGSVQGVGFRYFVQNKATSLGLTGWAENMPDGRVLVYASGPADRLRNLEEVLRVGPRAARVTAVDSRDVEGRSTQGFEIR